MNMGSQSRGVCFRKLFDRKSTKGNCLMIVTCMSCSIYLTSLSSQICSTQSLAKLNRMYYLRKRWKKNKTFFLPCGLRWKLSIQRWWLGPSRLERIRDAEWIGSLSQAFGFPMRNPFPLLSASVVPVERWTMVQESGTLPSSCSETSSTELFRSCHFLSWRLSKLC